MTNSGSVEDIIFMLENQEFADELINKIWDLLSDEFDEE